MKISEKKNINAIVFFASKSPNNEINRLKLMKLLWLADRMHLNKFGRLILKDKYSALPHGPVPSSTMNSTQKSIENFFSVNGFTIRATGDFDNRFFSKTDLQIMYEVWNSFGDKDQFELEKYSHLFPEWLRYKKDLDNNSLPNSYPIVIQDLFNPPASDAKYHHNEVESNKAKSIFNSHTSIQDFLSR